ncbi:putative nuclear hormone receptor HR3 [Hypsibius exemplaris]|uniref:Nuclear hormone receptor HR3 n=1 Tax=Hypsibius exemplaris TaxID=2072580 RepID=A0A1W0WZN8_HYPEX|nr:putative nuclear hormone receptor HR3 [Hypsibius exemplaris]
MPIKCLICGNRSTGVHYGVVSCEGCKAFYKRGQTKSLSYKCYFGQACFEDGIKSNRCKACRFQKCVQVGMNLQAPKRGRRTKERAFTISELGACHRDPNHYHSSVYNDKTGGRFRHIAPAGGGGVVASSTAISVITPNPGRDLLSLSYIRPFVNSERAEAISLLRNSGSFSDFTRIEIDRTPRAHMRWIDPYAQKNCLDYREKVMSDENSRDMPEFLGDYWKVIQQKGFLVGESLKVVEDAVKVIYGEQLTTWNEFMREAIFCNNAPKQPQCSLAEMLQAIRDSVAECQRKGTRFYFLLPGFSDFTQEDQKILLTEKWSETWLIVHSPYLWRGETYYWIGERNRQYHYCQYWMRQVLHPSHIAKVFSLSEDLNAVKLTVVESFLLLAVATFHPDLTTAKNKPFLTFLYGHYMDCLLQSIRSRCNLSEQILLEKRLRTFMKQFRSVYRLGNFYVRSLDFSGGLPFRAIRDSVVISVEDALTTSDDGLPSLESSSVMVA